MGQEFWLWRRWLSVVYWREPKHSSILHKQPKIETKPSHLTVGQIWMVPRSVLSREPKVSTVEKYIPDGIEPQWSRDDSAAREFPYVHHPHFCRQISCQHFRFPWYILDWLRTDDDVVHQLNWHYHRVVLFKVNECITFGISRSPDYVLITLSSVTNRVVRRPNRIVPRSIDRRSFALSRFCLIITSHNTWIMFGHFDHLAGAVKWRDLGKALRYSTTWCSHFSNSSEFASG